MNPEFQRNLWLEASPRRIAWAVVTLVVIYGAAFIVTRDLGSSRLTALAGVGTVVFMLTGVVWGARAAGNSVLTETGDRTWDFQRLSALTPWTMTWGKLFGATSLAWICALSGLVLFSLGATSSWNLVFFLALAVLAQAASLSASLIGVRKARAEGRLARSGGVLGGLILGALLLSWLSGSGRFGSGAGLSGLGRLFQGGGIVDWWGLEIEGQMFRALSVTVFAAFALAGAWRLMRLELQMKNAPLVWPLFLIAFAGWIAGFPVRSQGLDAGLLAGGLAMALCAYASAFAEPADRLRLRRFVRLTADGKVDEAVPLAPAALFALVMSVALIIGATVAGGMGKLGWQPVALVAFILRDLGVIALFRFGPRPQRGDFGAIVALVVLYAVGYMLSASLWGQGQGGAVFVPAASVISVISGLVQAVGAWWLAAGRIKAPESSVSAPPSAPASAPG